MAASTVIFRRLRTRSIRATAGSCTTLREKRDGGEHADQKRTCSELERESDQDDAAVKRAGEARPSGVGNQRVLAALDIFGADCRVWAQVHVIGERKGALVRSAFSRSA